MKISMNMISDETIVLLLMDIGAAFVKEIAQFEEQVITDEEAKEYGLAFVRELVGTDLDVIRKGIDKEIQKIGLDEIDLDLGKSLELSFIEE